MIARIIKNARQCVVTMQNRFRKTGGPRRIEAALDRVRINRRQAGLIGRLTINELLVLYRVGVFGCRTKRDDMFKTGQLGPKPSAKSVWRSSMASARWRLLPGPGGAVGCRSGL